MKLRHTILYWIAPLALTLTAPAAVIFEDDFSGSGAGNLNGTAPDIALGAETWLAHTDWSDAGEKTTFGQRSAFLPFTPVQLTNQRYYLRATLNNDSSSSSDWFALGFYQGSDVDFTIWNGNDAVAWMLDRENNDPIQTFLGPQTALGANHASSIDGPVDFMILLDTRFTQWSAEWYVNNQLIRNSSNTFGTNPNITHIGFSAFQDATGSVDFFQFGRVDAALPEPSTAIFSVFGFFLLRGLRAKQEEYC